MQRRILNDTTLDNRISTCGFTLTSVSLLPAVNSRNLSINCAVFLDISCLALDFLSVLKPWILFCPFVHKCLNTLTKSEKQNTFETVYKKEYIRTVSRLKTMRYFQETRSLSLNLKVLFNFVEVSPPDFDFTSVGL